MILYFEGGPYFFEWQTNPSPKVTKNHRIILLCKIVESQFGQISPKKKVFGSYYVLKKYR